MNIFAVRCMLPASQMRLGIYISICHLDGLSLAHKCCVLNSLLPLPRPGLFLLGGSKPAQTKANKRFLCGRGGGFDLPSVTETKIKIRAPSALLKAGSLT